MRLTVLGVCRAHARMSPCFAPQVQRPQSALGRRASASSFFLYQLRIDEQIASCRIIGIIGENMRLHGLTDDPVQLELESVGRGDDGR